MSVATKKPRAKRERVIATDIRSARRPRTKASDPPGATDRSSAGPIHGGPGDPVNETESSLASDHQIHGGRNGDDLRDAALTTATCRQIQELQRRRVATLKARIAIDNQLAALVAQEMGYSAGMDEADRKQRRADASKLIAIIAKGKPIPPEWQEVATRQGPFIETVTLARDPFQSRLDGFEDEMVRLVKELPIGKWFDAIRGVKHMSAAVIIGECGDLSLYANPGKVWRRLGLAPFNGKMPSTWKSGREGKLSSEEWTTVGYSPRRRSAMYVIGDCIVKGNGEGIYRKRYDDVKVIAAEKHPDWSKLRVHRHAMLLATKMLVRDMWIEWNGRVTD